MDDTKQQIIEKLQAANNILVTVSTNPSVDQLSACIGLTLLLNKMGKHASAVFSGKVPSTIGFLKPEETIEKNTDSLRDFIISLDKSKADKLRYKVEDEVVKIFITPYKSSISEKDLVFSQGDFNVDVVMALGVHQQQDLDAAITAHGRILHDAVVVSINNTPNGNLGSINWQNISASGVSELVTSLVADLSEDDLLDAQIATALLTGIVAETDHFGNQKTTPQTMTMSATLLAAGANQQLVSSELGHAAEPAAPAAPAAEEQPAKKPPKDQLKIKHDSSEDKHEPKADEKQPDDIVKLPPEPEKLAIEDTDTAPVKEDKEVKEDEKPEAIETSPSPEATSNEASIDSLLQQAEAELAKASSHPAPELPPSQKAKDEKVIAVPASEETATDDAPQVATTPLPEPVQPPAPSPVPPMPSLPSTPPPQPFPANQQPTLSDIEQSIQSPHAEAAEAIASAETPSPATDVSDARKAVEDALKGNPDDSLTEAFNAVPVNLDLGHENPAPDVQPGPGVPPSPGLPDYLRTPSMTPGSTPDAPPSVPPTISVPPPQAAPPTSVNLPPAGPPPPPVPPPPMPPQPGI